MMRDAIVIVTLTMIAATIDTIYNQKFQTRVTHGTFNADPEQNGQLVVEASDNSTLVFKYRGTDGIVRSATLALT